MKITLKPEVFRHILKDIKQYKFTSDGCACGEYAYQLDNNLWLTIYRGCKKSYTCPDNKWWHVNDIQFYKHVEVRTHRGYDDYKYRTVEWDEEEDLLENVKLDKHQSEIIIQRARRVTKVSGYDVEFKKIK